MGKANVVNNRQISSVGWPDIFNHKNEGQWFVDEYGDLYVVVQHTGGQFQLIAMPDGNRVLDTYTRDFRRLTPVNVDIFIKD